MQSEDRKGHKNNQLWLGLGLAVGAAAGALLWQRKQALERQKPLTTAEEPGMALITGASSGIGAVYARQLAKLGYDVILVARRAERLQALAQTLEQDYGIKAEVLVADLSVLEDIERVSARIRDEEYLHFLVNNAGFGIHETFATSDVEQQVAMLRVHMLATTRFTHAALPQMLECGQGNIVNVASVMAFYPLASWAMYSATKAALVSFTEALHQEVDASGVNVQALCPGFTRTEFQDSADFNKHGLPEFVWMWADDVVAHSLRDLQRGQVISVPGALNQALVALGRVVPRPLMYWSAGVLLGTQSKAEGMMEGFHRRTYGSLADFMADARFMQQNREKLRYAMATIAPEFRERLMLAVTQVNECRYCAQYHAQLALEDGLSQEEIDQLLSGELDGCPENELTAVLYAQHWADKDGHPDPEARQTFVETYGVAQAEAIEVLLRMIRSGNYMGNTLDYVLYRLSGGRWGC